MQDTCEFYCLARARVVSGGFWWFLTGSQEVSQRVLNVECAPITRLVAPLRKAIAPRGVSFNGTSSSKNCGGKDSATGIHTWTISRGWP